MLGIFVLKIFCGVFDFLVEPLYLLNMENKEYTRPKTDVICQNPECGKVFKKIESEIRRTNKRGGKHYCSLSCAGKISGKVKKKR